LPGMVPDSPRGPVGGWARLVRRDRWLQVSIDFSGVKPSDLLRRSTRRRNEQEDGHATGGGDAGGGNPGGGGRLSRGGNGRSVASHPGRGALGEEGERPRQYPTGPGGERRAPPRRRGHGGPRDAAWQRQGLRRGTAPQVPR